MRGGEFGIDIYALDLPAQFFERPPYAPRPAEKFESLAHLLYPWPQGTLTNEHPVVL